MHCSAHSLNRMFIVFLFPAQPGDPALLPLPIESVEGIAPFEIPLPACGGEREGGRRRGRASGRSRRRLSPAGRRCVRSPLGLIIAALAPIFIQIRKLLAFICGDPQIESVIRDSNANIAMAGGRPFDFLPPSLRRPQSRTCFSWWRRREISVRSPSCLCRHPKRSSPNGLGARLDQVTLQVMKKVMDYTFKLVASELP